MRRGERGSVTTGLAGCAGALLLVVGGAVAVLALLVSSFDLDFGTGDIGDPGEGRASLRLAVEASPATGLEDGTPVTVTSTAFGPHAIVGVAVCLREAGSRSAGVDACDTVSGARYAVDASGNLRAVHPVPRVVTIGDRAVDCAETARRCILVAADASDFDRSGGVPISFRPELPAPELVPRHERPVSDLLPSSPARLEGAPQGTVADVSAMGFQAGEPLLVAHCIDVPAQAMESSCQPLDMRAAMDAVAFRTVRNVQLHADERGAITTDVPVAETLRPFPGGGERSCTAARVRCSIVIAAAADLKRSAVVPYSVGPG